MTDSEREQQKIDFAKLAELVLKDLNLYKFEHTFTKKFTRDELSRYLDLPERHEKPLRDASRLLYNKSSHYRRLIQYFAKMPLFYYGLEPVGINPAKANIKQIQTQFQKITEFLELMNLKHEFQKILITAFKEDVFYGYEWMNDDSYFIQKLNPEYCSIISIEDGVYNLSFDFNYFNVYPEKLPYFPEEFRQRFEWYNSDTLKRWQELDSEKTICIKINEDVDAIIPPFSGVFDALYDIEDFKSLRKHKERMDNYKILVQKIPMKQGANVENKNEFLIDFEYVSLFHNKTANALPDHVGLISSPMEISDISFDKDKSDFDNVAKAERDFWSGAGVPQNLFNTDKGSSIGIGLSIKTDEEIIFSVLRQFERWLNRRIRKYLNKPLFKVSLLNITVFNQGEVFDRYLQASQFGIPVKMLVGASLGISPNAMIAMAFVENDVFGLHEKFIPLSSAHTASLDQGGRPNKPDTQLSPSGEKARSNDANANAKG